MISVPVVSASGEPSGQIEIDPESLGGKVRPALLKQAVVAYLEHQRQYSSRTRSRGMVAGSTRKLYRQKGTGRARMGALRTPIRRGGGVTFAKQVPASRKRLSRQMRSLAWRNAVLVKLLAEEAVIVDGLGITAPKTSALAKVLSAVGADSGCVLATDGIDRPVYLSGRNIPRTEIRPIEQLNAYEVLRRRKLVFTRPAFEALVKRVSNGDANGADEDAS